MYVPLATYNASSVDLLIFALHVTGLSSLLGAINFVVTILKSSSVAAGWAGLPVGLYQWSMLVTSMLLIVSLPVLAGCITMVLVLAGVMG